MIMREVTDRDFDQVVKQAGVPVLVEFWKPGCGSCRALMRELETLESDVTGKMLIVKMNVEENFQIPAELEVRKFSSSYGWYDTRRYNVRQVRPSFSMRRLASTGPQVPAGYSGNHRNPCRCHPSRILVIHAQDASTASRRMNREASPAITSKSNRS
jgi:thiol-disulfide isomerase/thioredoxin